MRRWLVVLVLAACGSRGNDSPPPPPPQPVTKDAPAPPVPTPPVFEVPPPADKLVAVGRGDRHACVVRASGAVDCWGQHRRPCKDCRRHTTPDSTIRRVTGIDDAVAISANATCFLRRGGEVACLAPDTLTAVHLAGITDARIGDPKARCFIDSRGGVSCIDADDKPWKVPNVTDAVAIHSGEFSTCIVRKAGTIACGSIRNHAPFRTARGIDGVTELVMVGRLEDLACAVTRGRVRCFLLEAYPDPKQPFKAEFVHDGQSIDLPHPEPFVGATQLAMWNSGMYDNFILEAVVGGKIVRMDFINREPFVLPVLTDAVIHTRECAIRAQGSLVCWGANFGGVLAQQTTLSSFEVPATTVVGLSGVVEIATGVSKTFALTADGRVWWWGHIEHLPELKGSPVPVELPLALGETKIVQLVATAKDHLCVRSSGGDVWCQTWEVEAGLVKLETDNVHDIEALGLQLLAYRVDGTVEQHTIATWDSNHLAPMTIERLAARDITQFANVHSLPCSRRRDGTVRCPDPVPELTAATALVAGDYHACAIQRGRVWCWLDDHEEKRSPATEMPGLRDVTDLASSADHACAVHENGRVSCWRFEKRTWLPPQQVIPAGAVDVELGTASSDQHEYSFRLHGPQPAGQYGCARMADRTVRCWGANLYGELGDGSFVEAKSPIGIKL